MNFLYVLISDLLDIIYNINVITVELINNLLRYASPRTPANFPSKTSAIKSVYQDYTDSLSDSTVKEKFMRLNSEVLTFSYVLRARYLDDTTNVQKTAE